MSVKLKVDVAIQEILIRGISTLRNAIGPVEDVVGAESPGDLNRFGFRNGFNVLGPQEIGQQQEVEKKNKFVIRIQKVLRF